ncbi:MAG: DUF3857 domain-containing protein [Bacteroidota bacterium]|nr:DUF3857 domain-containing protein [Bacteroidota bacterium]
MKQYFFLVTCIFAIQFVLQAQDFNNEYGKVGKEDFDLSCFAQDKSAEAVVISDDGCSYFGRRDDSFDIIYERTTRLKIFKEAGIKWANIEIPYYREGDIFEEVSDIEACTYNFENGLLTRTNLDVKNCQEEKVNEYWTLKKFAMPNVKEGSIIEYRYKVQSQFLFNLRDWNFQWKIPVIYSRYVTKMIPFYQYTWLLQGANKFDAQKSYVDQGIERQFGPVKYQDMVYEYVMKNVPAFKDEEFIASSDDYSIKLNFQLSAVTNTNGSSHKVITTWPELVNDLIKNEDFGGYYRRAEGLASKIFDLKSLSLMPARQKFDSILNYVKANYSWNKMNGKMASKTPKTFMKDKFGNDADINLFTVGLLNAAGVKANPVIISTRKNGKIRYDYPFSHFFNYVIVMADFDGKKVLADATTTLSSNDRISEKCINDKGLIIQKEKVEWVGLQTLVPSKTQKTIQITLTDSTQHAAVQNSYTEYLASDYRNEYGTNTRVIKKLLLDKGYSPVDSSIVVKNQFNLKEPYSFKYVISDHPEKVNGKIYVSPFLHEIISENPLKQAARTYPIDMIYPKRTSVFAEVNIPEGYKVDFLPPNDRIKNDQFELEYLTSTSGNKINVSLIYYFKIPVYDADEYNKIKYYFNEIVNKGSEKIVFVKDK